MTKVIKVSFNEKGNFYYFKVKDFTLKKNMEVLVESDNGVQFAKTVSDIMEIDASILKSPLKDVLRKATKKDCNINRKNIKDAEQALKVCKKLAEQYELNISIIDASYNFDRSQLLFHFVADSRIDFRELARALAAKYHTRIELRQIGVRDKAKATGGLGSCGQKLCCSRFLKEFNSVSINMAKNQNIALNPTKINGVCGRLLCCLNYENDIYTENRKMLPKIGEKRKEEEGTGEVISLDIINKSYVVDIPKVGQVTKRIEDASN